MALALGLALGLSFRRAPAAGYTFTNAEAAALAARFTTPPTNARAAQIDTLVGGLKTAGVWSKLDAFYVTAAAEAQAARQNWIADQFNLSALNSPAFTIDRGYAGDGAASYLETSFNPTTAVSPKYTLNDAHLGVWTRNDTQVAASGVIGNGNSRIGSATGNSTAGGRPVNSGTAVLLTTPGFPGHTVISRSNLALWEGYNNGIDVGGGVTASTAVSNETIQILKAQGAGFCAAGQQIAAAHFGSNLTASDDLALYNALQTYMTAVGA